MRKRVTPGRVLVALAVVVVLVGIGAGGLLLPRVRAQIGGRVQGLGLPDPLTGATAETAIAATVRCNGVTARAAADGTYRLTLPAAAEYRCTATDAPDYGSVAAAISLIAGLDLTLDFGVTGSTTCAAAGRPSQVECPALRERSGGLSGTVADGAGARGGVAVQCWDTDLPLPAAGTPAPVWTGTSDARGRYTLTMLPIGHYACVAGDDPTLRRVAVAAGAPTPLDLPLCSSDCPAVTYHQGTVMHSLSAYVIFWLPRGFAFEPSGNSARFEALIKRYFLDLAGTPFYGILTQYWDGSGPIRGTVALAGSYVDTTAYPHAGSQRDPLLDGDVQAEVTRAMQANGWDAAPDHAFFVLTGYGVQECSDADPADGCTFGSADTAFCGYHGDFGQPSGVAIYSYINVTRDCVALPSFTDHPSPNGDMVADGALDTVSHEQFESVTDPISGSSEGWYEHHDYDGEIGDLCADSFGDVAADGGNVTLAHGDRYIVQGEWSDAAGGCSWGA